MDQQDANGEYRKIFDAVFLMVARDPMNAGGALINPLIAETEAEKTFLHAGLGKNNFHFSVKSFLTIIAIHE